MKKIILFTAFVFISIACFSQDLISLKRGAKFEVIVTEITPTLVRYKLFSEPNGKVYFVYKEDVVNIQYKDGRVESFNQPSSPVIENKVNTEVKSQPSNNNKSKPVNFTQPPRKSKGKDVVYLNNGRVIQGTITEQEPNKPLVIKTADGNVFTYPMDDIDKIVEGTIGYNDKSGSSSSGLNRGYKGIIDVGYYLGVGANKINRLDFNFINGYQINPYFSLGIGVGFNYYIVDDYSIERININKENKFLLPLFADFRVNFINGPISPYLSMDIGYSLNASDNFHAFGILVNPTIGVSLKVSERNEIHIGLGYQLQGVNKSYNITNWWGNYNYPSQTNLEAIAMKVGFSF